MKDKPDDLSPHTERFDKKEVREIPLECIIPNRYQPRKTIEKESLQELIDSISTHGVLQPIVVRKAPNPIRDGRGAKDATISNGAEKADIYEIMMGERRFRSCQALKKATIPAIVTEADDQRMMECALVENTHRKDLNPIERAEAYKLLADTFNLTQEEVAKRVGADRTMVSHFIRMLGLPPEIQADVKSQKITVGHAIAILAIPDSTRRLMVWHRVRNEDLSVRNTRVVVDAYLHPRGVAVDSTVRNRPRYKELHEGNDPEIRELQQRLWQKFGSGVHITVCKMDDKIIAGGVHLSFGDDKEYRHIIEMLGK